MKLLARQRHVSGIPGRFNVLADHLSRSQEWQLFYVAGYLIEERRRWPIITASPRGKCSK